jgi:hypothetical protein
VFSHAWDLPSPNFLSDTPSPTIKAKGSQVCVHKKRVNFFEQVFLSMYVGGCVCLTILVGTISRGFGFKVRISVIFMLSIRVGS